MLNEDIRKSLRKQKINIRNYILMIRENLRTEFDDFFNNLLHMVRKDWNLFGIQAQMISETNKFSQQIKTQLENIINLGGQQDGV